MFSQIVSRCAFGGAPCRIQIALPRGYHSSEYRSSGSGLPKAVPSSSCIPPPSPPAYQSFPPTFLFHQFVPQPNLGRRFRFSPSLSLPSAPRPPLSPHAAEKSPVPARCSRTPPYSKQTPPLPFQTPTALSPQNNLAPSSFFFVFLSHLRAMRPPLERKQQNTPIFSFSLSSLSVAPTLLSPLRDQGNWSLDPLQHLSNTLIRN